MNMSVLVHMHLFRAYHTSTVGIPLQAQSELGALPCGQSANKLQLAHAHFLVSRPSHACDPHRPASDIQLSSSLQFNLRMRIEVLHRYRDAPRLSNRDLTPVTRPR